MRFRHLSLLPVLMCASISSTLLQPQTAAADDDNGTLTAWTLGVHTEELKRQFEYKGSAISPVAKVSVEFYPTGKENQKKQYESIWYHDGKPLGFERNGTFGLDQGKNANIRILPKGQAGVQEEKAAADIILRLVLDAYHNADSVLAIRVPPQNFSGIVNAMNALGCVESQPGGPDEASKAKLSFTIQTDDQNGPVTHLFFL